MNLDYIPVELKGQDHFVCWSYEIRKGERTKVPKNPRTGKNAMSNNPKTWGTLAEATRYYEAHKNNGIAGIGFELGDKATALVGWDLDHCHDSETGAIEPWALDIVKRLDSYTEVTPSGTGLRIFVTAILPPEGRKKGDIECYDSGRFLTLTGAHLEETPFTIEERHSQVEALHKEIFDAKENQQTQGPRTVVETGDDSEILDRARSAKNGAIFSKLWTGDWKGAGYTSQSEADMALCLHLAFWTGRDAERIDRLFRQSGLMREKWDEKHGRDTYGNITIEKAIASAGDVYKGHIGNKHNGDSQPAEQGIEGLQFPDVISGLAGEFSKAFSAVLEVPPHFFFMSFLTCLGNIISDKVSIDSELRIEPRLYTLLLGQSADDRKSTALSRTVGFFRETLTDFNVCWGVGSAEGLQERLNEGKKLVLSFDEFKQFVSKCRIDSSVLLSCVTSLFENTWYESHVKGKSFKLPDVHVSLLAASTVDTYQKTWDPAFTAIGFNNRLFLVPGQGERKFAFPVRVSDEVKDELRQRLGLILQTVSGGLELKLTDEARALYERWYMGREQGSIHSRRLDTYATRLMMLLAVNNFSHTIDTEIVKKATALCDWQYRVRQLYDPIDADNVMAVMEERIRRVLGARGSLTDRELQQHTNAKRTGQWFFSQAKQNLVHAGEIRFDEKAKKWAYVW